MPNQTVNKVQFGGQTVIDITDTTADAADVIEGEVFYSKSGARSIGSLGDATQSMHGLMSTTDKTKLDSINNENYYKVIDTPADVISIDDAIEAPVKQLKIAVEPVQDLHGHDKPWVGGAGKNLLPMTLADIKLVNTAGTWSGNAYTYNNVVYNVLTDYDGNVVGFNVNGTANATGFLYLTNWFDVVNGQSYLLNGITDGSQSTYKIDIIGSNEVAATAVTTDTSFTGNSSHQWVGRIVVYSGVAMSNVKLYPMLRLSTVSDATFEPYTNICPISGHTQCDVVRTGKNLLDSSTNTQGVMIDASGNVVSGFPQVQLTDYIPVSPSTQYVISGTLLNNGGNVGVRANYFDQNKTWKYRTGDNLNNGLVFTTDSDTRFVRLSYALAATNAQLEKGSTGTSYESFGDTYTYSFSTTVYGGTLTVNRDGTRTLVVDKLMVLVKNLEWTYDNQYARFKTTISGIKKGTGVRTVEFQTSAFISIHDGRSLQNVPNYGIYAAGVQSDNVYINCTDITDATQFVNLLGDEQIVYPIATSVTYPLTPEQVKTLLGVNNIWADTGKINHLEYPYGTNNTITTEERYKLNNLTGNVYGDHTITIHVSDWTLSNNIYTYTWYHSSITYQCLVDILLITQPETVLTGVLSYDKVTGGVQFTSTTLPIGDISLKVRIIDSDTTWVIQQQNAFIDIDITLQASSWSNSSPYVQTWTNDKITDTCDVKVKFLEEALAANQLYIGYEKVSGGLQFTAPTKPTVNIPIRIHIINADPTAMENLDAEMVSTDAISGAVNVQEALEALVAIPKIKIKRITISNLSANGNAEIRQQLGLNYGSVIILACRIVSPIADLKAVPIMYLSGGNAYPAIHVETTAIPPSAYTSEVTVDVVYLDSWN